MKRRLAWLVPSLVATAVVLLAAALWLPTPSERESQPSLDRPRDRGVKRYTPAFPRTMLVTGLLDPPLRLERDSLSGPDYFFLDGPDGSSAFWRAAAGHWTALDETQSPRGEINLTEDASPALWVRPAGGQALRLDYGAPGAGDYAGVSVVRADGSVAWTWMESSVEAVDVLYDERAPVGFVLAVGGEEGLVALDLDGRPLWNLPKLYVVYDVTSHPRLPGFLLTIGGDAILLSSAATRGGPTILLGAVEEGRRFYGGTYVTAGCLFPDGDGRPALLLTGDSSPDPPVLFRVDERGEEVWRAVLPSDAKSVVLVEPRDGPRLFILTTEGGEILVVGDDGTLYASERMPRTADNSWTATYGLSSGEFRAGAWGVAVELLEHYFIYQLHPERIPRR